MGVGAGGLRLGQGSSRLLQGNMHAVRTPGGHVMELGGGLEGGQGYFGGFESRDTGYVEVLP